MTRRLITIAVLFLEGDTPESYGISAYAKIWEEDGITVRFLFGTRTHVPADLLFLHINLSVLPESIMEFAARYLRVVNLQARDIRKRRYSSLLVDSDSDCRGEVIVKTDLNYGGVPEVQLHPDPLYRLACKWRQWRLKTLRPVREWRKTDLKYPVYPSVRDVPEFFWKSQSWVVEKFVPERLGDHYVIRNYKFLGNRYNTLIFFSDTPFIRDHPLKISPVETDPAVRDLRARLQLDFGKIDYIMVDGKPVVLDINKTMGYNPQASVNPEVVKARRELAEGIYDYLN